MHCVLDAMGKTDINIPNPSGTIVFADSDVNVPFGPILFVVDVSIVSAAVGVDGHGRIGTIALRFCFERRPVGISCSLFYNELSPSRPGSCAGRAALVAAALIHRNPDGAVRRDMQVAVESAAQSARIAQGARAVAGTQRIAALAERGTYYVL